MTQSDRFFTGEVLYGDDFTAAQIQQWFEDEKEAYADLGAGERGKYVYEYHALNWQHGFKHLPRKTYEEVLGFGSAYGDELKPWIQHIGKITILDPSDQFNVEAIEGKPVRYVKPTSEGKLPFGDNHFDLITIFGCLHHIPNVSFVISELVRCLKPGGYLLMREPCVSMGDWRQPRKGLTLHERGISATVMQGILEKLPVQVLRRARCMFPVTRRLRFLTRKPVFNSWCAVQFDRLVCALFGFNNRYHPVSFFQKLQAACLFLIIQKK